MTTAETGLPLEPEETEDIEQEAEAPASPANQKDEAAAATRLRLDIPAATHGGAPEWVQLPAQFRFPRGKQILFVRFRSEWTDTPWKGEMVADPETGSPEVDAEGTPILYRQCVLWPINTADKRLALNRAQRDPNRAADELTKQMIRVHDGVVADWATVRANGVEMFWNEIGEKCRGLLHRMFSQLHVLDTNSTRDFLANCIEVRSTGS